MSSSPSSAGQRPMVIATRGSALAMAQANQVLNFCRQKFPRLVFEVKIIKTTGDKLSTASLANPDQASTKGLFTKELEVALQNEEADLAVHSLKDLPTDLPPGLELGAVCRRADVRDVMIYRDAEFVREEASQNLSVSQEWRPGDRVKRGFKPGLSPKDLPQGAVVATSSTRRQALLHHLRTDLKTVPIRGNVGTRLQKLAEKSEFDALILAAAGLERLHLRISPKNHRLQPQPAAVDRSMAIALPPGLLATFLEPEVMLPAVGQAAIGIEVRSGDERIQPICQLLDHHTTHLAVRAERAFLQAMGGGCQSPIAAYAQVIGHQIRLRAISFRESAVHRADLKGPLQDPESLGRHAAGRIQEAEG